MMRSKNPAARRNYQPADVADFIKIHDNTFRSAGGPAGETFAGNVQAKKRPFIVLSNRTRPRYNALEFTTVPPPDPTNFCKSEDGTARVFGTEFGLRKPSYLRAAPIETILEENGSEVITTFPASVFSYIEKEALAYFQGFPR